MKKLAFQSTGAGPKACSRFFIVMVAALAMQGCAIVATRPLQEMSDTSSAIRAAKEVQADTMAPDLYREAVEWFQKSKREYRLKNFDLAKEYAEKSRKYAETAEWEAVRQGATRTAEVPQDQREASKPAPTASPSPYNYPTPTGTPAEVYDQRVQEELKSKTPAPQPSAATPPSSP